jgi:hypothetical protein
MITIKDAKDRTKEVSHGEHGSHGFALVEDHE